MGRKKILYWEFNIVNCKFSYDIRWHGDFFLSMVIPKTLKIYTSKYNYISNSCCSDSNLNENITLFYTRALSLFSYIYILYLYNINIYIYIYYLYTIVKCSYLKVFSICNRLISYWLFSETNYKYFRFWYVCHAKLRPNLAFLQSRKLSQCKLTQTSF